MNFVFLHFIYKLCCDCTRYWSFVFRLGFRLICLDSDWQTKEILLALVGIEIEISCGNKKKLKSCSFLCPQGVFFCCILFLLRGALLYNIIYLVNQMLCRPMDFGTKKKTNLELLITRLYYNVRINQFVHCSEMLYLSIHRVLHGFLFTTTGVA